MSNSQRHNQPSNQLSLILTPSPPSPPVSNGQSRPAFWDSASISHQKRSLSRPVKTLTESLQLLSSTPTMHPLLSGPASSSIPLIVFSQACGGPGPLAPQPPRGRPHASDSLRSRSRTTSYGKQQATGLPKPYRPSPDLFLPMPPRPQKDSHTLRNQRGVKHRASVDVSSAAGWITSTNAVGTKQVTTASNRSMWTHKRRETTAGGDVWDREARLGPVKSLQGPLPERQRVMNVRRAKKMQQVFGSEPPHSLFQITHVPPVPEAGNNVIDGFDDRASVSTLLSTSTINLQSTKTISGCQRTVSASSSTRIGPTPPPTPTTPREEREPLLPRIERSITVARDPPAEAPPFSHMVYPHVHKTVASGGTSKATARTEASARRKETEFRQRRMRAAKLSKFFGVDYHDLEPHLVPEERRDVRKVEVAIDDRGALPWDRRELRSLEMEDVIARLRDLRSS